MSTAPVASCAAGRLQGRRAGGLEAYLGIPYAQPPTGPLRWAAPQPASAWSGLREAAAPGPIAPQAPSPFDELLFPGRSQLQDEACLTLNLWTPGCDSARRPVLVWVHGGGFTIGAGSQPLYDGRHLAAAGDTVVVTLNYRLGALGFLRLAGVSDGELPASGNEGLLDVVAALRWVRANVAAFGGDPGNLTVFGESAGGMLVGALLALPAARGLFRRAILQSGAAHAAQTVAEADRVAARFVELLGLGAAEAGALRRLPVPRLLAAQQALLAEAPRSGLGFLPFRPVLDGATLPRLPIDAVRAGEARGVAVLAGVTADEWTLFAGLDPQLGQLDQAGLRRRLGYQFDAAETERLLELYPPLLRARGIEPTPGELLTAVTGDRWFRAPCARLLQAQAAHRDDTHAYLFDWPARHRRLRACHALELGFLFGWRDRGFHGGGPAAERLQAALQLAWSAFARDGRPHAATLGAWPACSAGQLHWMGLGEAPGVREGGWEALAGFWAGIDDERLRRV